jgi:Tfp pilus assembly protein PilV
MKIRARRKAVRGGSSLVEVTLALLVFSVMVLGSVHYRYLTVLGVERAREELAAADLAVTLIETWQGSGGDAAFDPATVFAPNLNIALGEGDAGPAGYALLGSYDVIVAGRTYQSTLYWKDVVSDLRELGATVSWPLGDEGQEKTYQLATYIRR